MAPTARSITLAIVVVTGLASARPADACLWRYGTNVHGERVRVGRGPGGEPADYVRRFTDRSHHREMADAWRGPAPAPDADFTLRSDHAVALIYQGHVAEAVPILESIERQRPGEYAIAANLGTAYELLGQDQQARRWIAEGLRRNPDGHHGTEWLHLRILDAKLALAAQPDWLLTHSVLGVDFGSGPVPAQPATWPAGQDAARTQRALEYQLGERTGFVAPPDPIVADLLADLGNLVAVSLTVEHAAAVYDLALTYRPARASLVEARRAYLATVPPAPRPADSRWYLWLVGAAALALVSGATLLVVGRRRGR